MRRRGDLRVAGHGCLAISFLEAPLKFRAPGVTVPIGLAIGRLVFKTLNIVEVTFTVILVVVVLVGPIPTGPSVALGVAAASLAVQLSLVRPMLARRTDAALAGRNLPRSHAHHAYVVVEMVKAGALLLCGVALLTS